MGLGWSQNGGFDFNSSVGYTKMIEKPDINKITEYNLKDASSEGLKQRGGFDCLICAVDYFDSRSYDEILREIGNSYNPETGTNTMEALEKLYGKNKVSAYSELNPVSIGRQMELGNLSIVAQNRNHAIVPIKIEIF
ncbi:hypothetical protein ACFOUP_00505 [Belliella kenyensis]|uniref:Uncharacterized protein n=1 Tax=Belliella kenyensis TaxID=1472724 RepID=A0ABV8EFN6_9BACT|nr:hypothetical protein [Belliella kenyensis]MCH7401833.1 hypothetical protein [Belliella kenyensis]MDN3604333.1 hypothetical protein [Belliella kenyensis]